MADLNFSSLPKSEQNAIDTTAITDNEKNNKRYYSVYSHDIDRLSLLMSDISQEQEIELRTCISQRFSKNSMFGNSGSIITLPFSLSDKKDEKEDNAMCYFYNLQMDNLSKQSSGDIRPLVSVKQFIICFIGQRDENLDLFQHDFDDFCSHLHLHYDGQSFDEDHMRQWYEMSVEYLSLVVNTFHHSLKHLLYLSLMGLKYNLSGASPSLSHAIKQFVASCSLSELLQPDSQETTSDMSESGELINFGNEVQSAAVQEHMVVTVTEDSLIVQDTYVTQFCEDWCSALMDKVKMGPVCLKQINNSYKLKCIHDVNELNRLIRLAENDHYALFRTYTFLKGCLNARVLLLYAKQENRITKSRESESVLSVLSDFMAHTGGVEQ